MRKNVRTSKKKDTISVIPLKVHPLPEGIHHNVTIHKPWGRKEGQGFAVMEDGRVFTLGWYVLDMSDENRLGMNDTIRRQYARLAGIDFSALREAINDERAVRSDIRHSDKLQDLRDQARKLGYELKELR